MSHGSKSPERRGQLRLLSSLGKEIAEHEAALVTLRATEKKLIKQVERGRYADEIEQLRALVVNCQCGRVGL